jgi:hypothetical protein
MSHNKKAPAKPGKNMGSTSDGHMVPNKFMKKGGDKMPKKQSKKGY